MRQLKSIPLSLPLIGIYLFLIAAILIDGTYPVMVGKILVIIITCLCLLNPNLKHAKYSKLFYSWAAICWAYFLMTATWSYVRSETLSMISTFGYVLITCSALYYLMTYNPKYIYYIIRFFVFASILMAVVFIARFGTNLTGMGDREFFGKYGLNLNVVGLKCAIAGIFSFYLYKTQLFGHRRLYLAIVLLSIFIIVLTGSKKAFMLPIIVLGTYWFFNTKPRKRIFAILAILVIAIGAYFAIMKIPALYSIIGVRFEGMINGFTGEGKVDSSTGARLQFIEFGKILIAKRFWTGYGLGTFTRLHAIARPDEYASYSHNNFIELMVSGGMIGTFLYYSIYLILLRQLYRIIKYTKDTLSIFFFSILVGQLIMDYGMVSYYSWSNSIVITMAAAYTLQKYNAVFKNPSVALAAKSEPNYKLESPS